MVFRTEQDAAVAAQSESLAREMMGVACGEPLSLTARGMSAALTPESAFALVQERWQARVLDWACQVAALERRVALRELREARRAPRSAPRAPRSAPRVARSTRRRR